MLGRQFLNQFAFDDLEGNRSYLKKLAKEILWIIATRNQLSRRQALLQQRVGAHAAYALRYVN